MSKIGHNKPPPDPKETIKRNNDRRKLIVDDGIGKFKNIPLPTWIELSLIDVCNRSCIFCPKFTFKNLERTPRNQWATTNSAKFFSRPRPYTTYILLRKNTNII